MTSRRLTEAVIVGLLFASAAVWGTFYWKRSFQAGRKPVFYQEYFEPAIMEACGRGFLLAHPSVPAVTAFLQQKTDRLSCDQIPATWGLSEYGVYQKTWLYLMLTVAFTWRVLGISWSGMGPLFGVLFGATIVIAYGIFRLGMGRLVSLGGAAALTVSAVHLQNLPHLRDYAKAPFTLALILLLGLLVAGGASARRVMAIACAYGVILGIGYGFRTDFLIDIPVFFLVLFGFLQGGCLRNLPLKAAAAALCVTVFVATAWPVITAIRRGGGCQWHAVLLGLSDASTDALMVESGPYDFGHYFSDGFVYSVATAYALRVRPGVGHIDYCSPDYDAVTGRYAADLAKTFPGDMFTRILASVTQVVQLPFRWFDQPLPGVADGLYRVRLPILKIARGSGPVFVALALFGLTAADPRLGLFGVFFLFYFGGYPMLQFGIRHYFHLEFMTWWAIGFLVHQAALHARVRDRVLKMYAWKQSAVILGLIAAAILVTTWSLRLYQDRSAGRLFQQYVDAPKEALRLGAMPAGAVHRVALHRNPEADPFPADLLEVDLDAAHCGGANPTVTFAYDPPNQEFAHTRALPHRTPSAGPTRFFEPVYAHFAGVRFSDGSPGCVTGAYRVTSADRIPLLLSVRLDPGWSHAALHERMITWRPWRR